MILKLQYVTPIVSKFNLIEEKTILKLSLQKTKISTTTHQFIPIESIETILEYFSFERCHLLQVITLSVSAVAPFPVAKIRLDYTNN